MLLTNMKELNITGHKQLMVHELLKVPKSPLVWDKHLVMKYVGIECIYLTIYLFSCNEGYKI